VLEPDLGGDKAVLFSLFIGVLPFLLETSKASLSASSSLRSSVTSKTLFYLALPSGLMFLLTALPSLLFFLEDYLLKSSAWLSFVSADRALALFFFSKAFASSSSSISSTSSSCFLFVVPDFTFF